MTAIMIVLALLGIGTLGCTELDIPVTTPSLLNGEPPAISEGIAGRITDDGGRVVAGAMLQPKSLDENGPPIPELAVYSDANGQYAWRLFPGRYEMTVSAAGYQTASATATVNSSRVTTLDITLQRAR